MRRSIKSLLKTTGARPKRALGQNFLTSMAISQKIVTAAEIRPSDTILEIGPGLGALTLLLAKKAKRVIAIEKDENLSNTLKDMLKREKIENVEVLNRDILNFQNVLSRPSAPNKGTERRRYKLVANLPYNIATAVIMKFLEAETPPELMVVMVQKEIGQRICAKPPKMNKLAVFSQLYSQPKIIGYVAKEYFYPKPKVDGAILLIKPHPPAAGHQAPRKLFSQIVNAGFSQPRKQLINNLSSGLNLDREAVVGWLNKNNIKPTQRAESLTITDWQNLSATFPVPAPHPNFL